MKELPLVSIIAICYNHSKYLVETLNSIKNQTYANIELLIIDDHSTDNSVEVIQNWIVKNNSNCKFIAHQKNQGLCKTLNEALDVVEGEFYQGVACDDILQLEKIEIQINDFRLCNEEYCVVYSDAYIIDNEANLLYGRFIQRYKPKLTKLPSGNILNELLNSNFIPAMSVLIKTNIVKELGGYDENITYEDYDLWLRISRKYKFYYSDYVSCKYRLHNNNMHSSPEFKQQQLINSYNIFKKHIDLTIPNKKLKNIIKKMYESGSYKEYNNDILSLKLNSDVTFFLKYNIPYVGYYFFKKIKRII
jgi:glycosyltransferase involved in cell wall biosynthesis